MASNSITVNLDAAYEAMDIDTIPELMELDQSV